MNRDHLGKFAARAADRRERPVGTASPPPDTGQGIVPPMTPHHARLVRANPDAGWDDSTEAEAQALIDAARAESAASRREAIRLPIDTPQFQADARDDADQFRQGIGAAFFWLSIAAGIVALAAAAWFLADRALAAAVHDAAAATVASDAWNGGW